VGSHSELTDDFNGDKLDATKWDDHDPKWIGRPPALFMPSNVAIKNGNLELTAKLEECRRRPIRTPNSLTPTPPAS